MTVPNDKGDTSCFLRVSCEYLLYFVFLSFIPYFFVFLS